jgi:hypothetical protein
MDILEYIKSGKIVIGERVFVQKIQFHKDRSGRIVGARLLSDESGKPVFVQPGIHVSATEQELREFLNA